MREKIWMFYFFLGSWVPKPLVLDMVCSRAQAALPLAVRETA